MEPRKNSIRKRAKEIPLEIRLYVDYVYAWCEMHPKKQSPNNLGEKSPAGKWAKKMTSNTIKQIEKWQADGAELKFKKI